MKRPLPPDKILPAAPVALPDKSPNLPVTPPAAPVRLPRPDCRPPVRPPVRPPSSPAGASLVGGAAAAAGILALSSRPGMLKKYYINQASYI